MKGACGGDGFQLFHWTMLSGLESMPVLWDGSRIIGRGFPSGNEMSSMPVPSVSPGMSTVIPMSIPSPGPSNPCLDPVFRVFPPIAITSPWLLPDALHLALADRGSN